MEDRIRTYIQGFNWSNTTMYTKLTNKYLHTYFSSEVFEDIILLSIHVWRTLHSFPKHTRLGISYCDSMFTQVRVGKQTAKEHYMNTYREGSEIACRIINWFSARAKFVTIICQEPRDTNEYCYERAWNMTNALMDFISFGKHPTILYILYSFCLTVDTKGVIYQHGMVSLDTLQLVHP